MRRFRQLYYILVTALFTLTACQSDMADESKVPAGNGIVEVKINVSTAVSNATTRAVGDWEDEIADDDEMMNIWTVVIVDDQNQVIEMNTCKPASSCEIDNFITNLPVGKYTFYSFANIAASNLDALLGFAQGTIPALGNDDEVVSKRVTGVSLTKETADAATAKSVGNGFATNADNGFGSQGIPMSNRQTIEITSNESIELIVVRMMAKIELQVYNDKGTDVTIESVTLTDITKNADGYLKLFPKYTNDANANTMDAVHGDIQPNLTADATTGDAVLYNKTEVINATENSYANNGKPVKIAFYVNESATPINQPVNFGYFFLEIKLTGEEKARYVMIDNNGETTDDDNKWNYIARNDYRIIPIVLDDYKLDIIPYDFPAIGVYPASVKEEDGYYTINFHDYGHFHLQPVVTRYSDKASVDFTPTTPTEAPYGETTWGLVDDDFSKSWTSWTDNTKVTEYDNATGGFYRTGNTDTKDGDETGGEPIWYTNTDAPQWSPDGTAKYSPFIFGYIADPGSAVTTDKKVYHEFSIYLYKEGMSAPRQMTYRLYMILDQDQMIYHSRSRNVLLPRHIHGY